MFWGAFLEQHKARHKRAYPFPGRPFLLVFEEPRSAVDKSLEARRHV